jgi:GTP-binding protein
VPYVINVEASAEMGGFPRAVFLRGAVRRSQYPRDEGAEVAFAGRSNAGKSSALNAITGLRSLARTSKTPGRTRELNFFVLDGDRRLVDLPGYGYARVSVLQRNQWAMNLARYLRERRSLAGLMLIMDVRRPFTDLDRQLLEWCEPAGFPVHALLTKADKLSRNQARSSLSKARSVADTLSSRIDLQLFSATEPMGLEEARSCLRRWLWA